MFGQITETTMALGLPGLAVTGEMVSGLSLVTILRLFGHHAGWRCVGSRPILSAR